MVLLLVVMVVVLLLLLLMVVVVVVRDRTIHSMLWLYSSFCCALPSVYAVCTMAAAAFMLYLADTLAAALVPCSCWFPFCCSSFPFSHHCCLSTPAVPAAADNILEVYFVASAVAAAGASMWPPAAAAAAAASPLAPPAASAAAVKVNSFTSCHKGCLTDA
jgi:hypothetical protein